MTDSSTDTNPKPPQPARKRFRVILKTVLKGASFMWSMYRAGSKLIDLFKEILG